MLSLPSSAGHSVRDPEMIRRERLTEPAMDPTRLISGIGGSNREVVEFCAAVRATRAKSDSVLVIIFASDK